MSRFPIRARLAVAFSAALSIVLALAAAFVLARVNADLTESADEALGSRLDALSTAVASSTPEDPPQLPQVDADDYEDNFSQVLTVDGEVVASTLPAAAGPALTPAEAAEALRGEVLVEARDLTGVDGDARILGSAASGAGDRPLDRRRRHLEPGPGGDPPPDRGRVRDRDAGRAADRAARRLRARPRALRPVERMRAQADEVEPGSADRLTVPEADDELRRLGLTLNSMLERQSEALERERAFVADASHELRTPLAVLRAELEVAELEGGSAEQLRAAIRAALGEVDRLARLSDDLLVIAAADRGRIPIHREQVVVAELLERVADRFRRGASEQGRRIEVECEGEAECLRRSAPGRAGARQPRRQRAPLRRRHDLPHRSERERPARGGGLRRGRRLRGRRRRRTHSSG